MFSGIKLRKARRAAGLTQIALATAAGVRERTLGYYERGSVCPSANRAVAMARALGLPVEALMDFDPQEAARHIQAHPLLALIKKSEARARELAQSHTRS